MQSCSFTETFVTAMRHFIIGSCNKECPRYAFTEEATKQTTACKGCGVVLIMLQRQHHSLLLLDDTLS